MTNKNEMTVNPETTMVVNSETGEINPAGEIVVSETPEYKIVQLADGTFKKNMKYHKYASRTPQDEIEEMELYRVFNDSDASLVTQFKNMVGEEIVMVHLFTNPYQSFDEKTGVVTDGVTTTIQDPNGHYFTTSSKTVYHKVKSLVEAFGSPSQEGYKPLRLQVTGTKQKNGVQIDLKLLGRVQ